MRLVDVYSVPSGRAMLYELLLERTPEQSISHKQMPTWGEHKAFVDSNPYEAWYLIESGEGVSAEYVGAIYLTKLREVGIFIFKRFHCKGMAGQAINLLREAHPGSLLANVNPKNEASKKLWERQGGEIIQVTYAIPS